MVPNLDYKGIEFPVSKKVIIRLNQKIISVLMCLDMKIIKCIQFQRQQQDSNPQPHKIITHIMLTSKTLAELCIIKQSIKKKTFLYELFTML